jgi:hypothetical protein
MPIDQSVLDALLDADEAANGTDKLALHAQLQERRRKRAHAVAKQTQPAVGLAIEDWDKTVAFIRAPLTAEDMSQDAGALDHLLLTVQDAIDEGNQEDAVLAAFRVVRKVWAWNSHHLGPIEGVHIALAADLEVREQGRAA